MEWRCALVPPLHRNYTQPLQGEEDVGGWVKRGQQGTELSRQRESVILLENPLILPLPLNDTQESRWISNSSWSRSWSFCSNSLINDLSLAKWCLRHTHSCKTKAGNHNIMSHGLTDHEHAFDLRLNNNINCFIPPANLWLISFRVLVDFHHHTLFQCCLWLVMCRSR